ncbi:MAG: hypothetical protein DCC71_25730, partial [Proteobacteria bacterium]
LGALAATLARAAAIALVAGGAARFVRVGGEDWIGAGVDLVLAGAVFAGITAFGVATVGDESLRGALRRLARRVRRRNRA